MNEHSVAVALIALGAVFLVSLLADLVGRRTRLPRVTLLLLLGVLVGPSGLDIIPEGAAAVFPFVIDLALVMVAFLLGGELTLPFLRAHGREVLTTSLAVVLVSTAVVSCGLILLGWPLAIALLLGAISTSTDPVAVRDVVRESHAKGPMTRTLLGVVAVDDAWGIMMMSLVLAFVLGVEHPQLANGALLEGLYELVFAILLGCALGFPMAMLTGRIRSGEPTLAEALGGVLLCGGLAILLHVSFLLSAMTMGVVVANTARHHRRPFRAIEGIEWPFMILFFVLSGASLEVGALKTTLGLTSMYVLLRFAGRIGGGWIGSRLSGSSTSSPGIGLALLPQAGIAIGMALVVSRRVPDVGTEILTATVAGTILFEVFGPVLTRFELVRCGQTRGIRPH